MHEPPQVSIKDFIIVEKIGAGNFSTIVKVLSGPIQRDFNLALMALEGREGVHDLSRSEQALVFQRPHAGVFVITEKLYVCVPND